MTSFRSIIYSLEAANDGLPKVIRPRDQTVYLRCQYLQKVSYMEQPDTTDHLLRIIKLIRGNDPIINSVNVSGLKIPDSLVDEFAGAFRQNPFMVRLTLMSNSLSQGACEKMFDLIATNPKLTHIEVNGNSVSDAALEHLSRVLMKLSPTRETLAVVLRKNETITKIGARHLANALRASVPIHYLDLRYCSSIGDTGVEEIAAALEENTVLTGLDIIRCSCGELGTAALALSLTGGNKTLETLLFQDKLTIPGVSSLGVILGHALCALQALYLWNCDLNTIGLEVLCRSLRQNRSLSTLALSYNYMGDDGSLHLSDVIRLNKSIVKLQLGANSFSHLTAAFFGVALSRNNTLEQLDLSRNELTSTGVWPIAVALMDNRTLWSLDIRHNRIEASGAERLCELIAHSTAIRVLRLAGNPFGDASLELLASKLVNNKSIRELDIDEVRMTGNGFYALCEALIHNDSVEKLSVNKNALESAGSLSSMNKFGELLRENSVLKTIGMSGCSITMDGCRCVAEGISSNSTLCELDISSNSIGEGGGRMLLDALVGNYSLTRICWNDNDVEADSFRSINREFSQFLERNSYYKNNGLMHDMVALVKDDAFT